MADNRGPYSLLAELESVKHLGKAPIHLWHPEQVSEIDMCIMRDGSWLHTGSPITRQRLVRLFSTLLRKEGDQYFLVTPVAKYLIEVEDAPFQAVLLAARGEAERQTLAFTTNVADIVIADADHPLRFEIDEETREPSPYVLVRDELEARLSRNVFYQLADLAQERLVSGEPWMGVWSEGEFFYIDRVA